MTIKRPLFGLLVTSLLAPIVVGEAMADEAVKPNELSQAIEAIKPIFNLRLRYEGVDQDGFAETADALTYRIRAGFETGEFADTQFLIEFDHHTSSEQFCTTCHSMELTAAVP